MTPISEKVRRMKAKGLRGRRGSVRKIVLGEGYPDLMDSIWMSKNGGRLWGQPGYRARVPQKLKGKKIRLIAEIIPEIRPKKPSSTKLSKREGRA